MGRLRSGKNTRREQTPEVEEPAQEQVQTGTWHPVWIARYDDGGVFKHWALFVEDEQDANNSFIVHVMGSSGRFTYQQRRSNAHVSGSLVELIQVGHVHENNLKRLRDVAKNVEIKNHIPGWDCQLYVWTLLEELVAANLIDGEDELYTSGMQTARSRMEGFD